MVDLIKRKDAVKAITKYLNERDVGCDGKIDGLNEQRAQIMLTRVPSEMVVEEDEAVSCGECVGYLESIGYVLSDIADENVISQLWAASLVDEIVAIGYNGVKRAVRNWASNDKTKYRTFPKVAWIKDACKEIGGDPRAEKGRRVQAEAERQMELDHKRESEKYLAEHPEILEKIERAQI